MDALQKELKNREKEIKSELRLLFKTNLRITGWDVSEADNNEAAKLLLDIFREGLDEIDKDIKEGKFE
jgi:hypothetical protein